MDTSTNEQSSARHTPSILLSTPDLRIVANPASAPADEAYRWHGDGQAVWWVIEQAGSTDAVGERQWHRRANLSGFEVAELLDRLAEMAGVGSIFESAVRGRQP